MENQELINEAHDMVVQFRRAFGQPCPKHWLDGRPEDRVLQGRLVREEFDETINAAGPLDELDGYCDLLYVLLGAAIVLGFKREVFDGVKDSPFGLAADVTGVINMLERPGLPCGLLWVTLPQAINSLYKVAIEKYPKFQEAFKAVHAANMSKLWDADLTLLSADCTVTPAGDGSGRLIVKRPDGKIVKPSTFSPPDLRPFV